VGSGGGKTVLVLDDDPALRLLCRVNLELDGYRVLEASSLACAREALAREVVDAILLDVHVEDGDGRELLRELGEERPPTALFTGTEPFGAVVDLADAVIPKPFEIGQLRSTVADLVSQQHTAQVDSGR
jgi:DNA-binding response OmpR family regulator